jgi:adenine-specific DNA-methyltransferase
VDRGDDNEHVTVKPEALMRYLVRLITPPGGTVLDPFMGSGSTGKACQVEGFGFIGIELIREHFNIAQRRLSLARRRAKTTHPITRSS